MEAAISCFAYRDLAATTSSSNIVQADAFRNTFLRNMFGTLDNILLSHASIACLIAVCICLVSWEIEGTLVVIWRVQPGRNPNLAAICGTTIWQIGFNLAQSPIWPFVGGYSESGGISNLAWCITKSSFSKNSKANGKYKNAHPLCVSLVALIRRMEKYSFGVTLGHFNWNKAQTWGIYYMEMFNFAQVLIYTGVD